MLSRVANLDALTHLLRADDPWSRAMAARILGSLGEIDAIPALIHAGGDADPAARSDIERALATLWEKATEAQRTYLVCVAASGRGPRAGVPDIEIAVQSLAAVVSSEDPIARASAVRALGEMRASPAVPLLMVALHDGAAEVRRAAAESLTALASACPEQLGRIARVLRRTLEDGHHAVREAAYRGLIALRVIVPWRVDREAASRSAFVEALRAASIDEATEMLFERGGTLAGRPLQRTEWRDIASAIHDVRRGDRIVAIVASAERREQVVRALRLARACARPMKRGAPGTSAPKPTRAQLIDELRIEEDFDHVHQACGCSFCEPYAGESWRAWADGASLGLPHVLPVNAVQEEVIAAMAGRRGSLLVPPDFAQLHARLDDDARAHLFAAFHASHVPADTRAFLARHDLEAWMGAPTLSDPIRTGPELAAISILEKQRVHVHVREIDWKAITTWIVPRLVQPASTDAIDRRALVLAFLRFVTDAPRSARDAIREALPRLHADHRPLLLALGGDVVPFAEAAAGSTLVLHDLANNLVDLHEQRVPEMRFADSLRETLRAGAGTLRSLDYPSFRVVSRPSISLVRPETVAALADLASDLAHAHAIVADASAEQLLVDLLAHAGSSALAEASDALRGSIARAVEQHVIAHVVLDNVLLAASPEPVRIRRKHVRRFWSDPPHDVPRDLVELRARFDLDRIKEGLVAALIDQIHEPWIEAQGARTALKEGFIHLARTVATTYAHTEVRRPQPDEDAGIAAARLVDHLVQQIVHAPLELAQAIGTTPQQGLPRLQGGHTTAMERRFRHLLREASSAATVVSEHEAQASIFTCRPIDKRAALDRGRLGRDCSTQSVPLRALSPHHVYYGIFEGDEQRPGYMTIFEAWAERDGEKRKVLCLETINVPIDRFDPIQQDLLLMFDSIARSRGLDPEVVLVTGIGTWNYRNGALLETSRRFRRGRDVKLSPADPVSWKLYAMATREARYYSAFNDEGRGVHRSLAPFDAEIDRVEPENLKEAQRLLALTPRIPVVTVESAEGPLGFISALPDRI